MTRRLFWLLACVLLSLATAAARAQPAGALGEDFIYVIRPGDTLIGVAETYTGDPSNWSRLGSVNQVADPQRLPIALNLRIPFSLIPEQPAAARIAHVQGAAEIDGAPARVGAAVPEGATLRTAADGFVTVELADGSAVTVPGGSAVQIERLRAFVHGGGLGDTILRVGEGAVESQVAPSGQGVGRFEIRTPVAVTGVRGTRFRMQAGERGATSEVLEGSVRLQPGAASAGQPVTVASGHGAVVGADGGLIGLRPLLPAPELGQPVRIGGAWTVPFPAIPGAVRYRIRVSTDADGTRPVSSREVDTPDQVQFSATGTGTFHVSIQGVDDAGLAGRSATRPFDGVRALMTSSGLAVATGTGGLITLADY
ncbi:FecR family protein [Bordetella sp. 2513F-2]